MAQLNTHREHPDAARAVQWKWLFLSVKDFFLLVPGDNLAEMLEIRNVHVLLIP